MLCFHFLRIIVSINDFEPSNRPHCSTVHLVVMLRDNLFVFEKCAGYTKIDEEQSEMVSMVQLFNLISNRLIFVFNLRTYALIYTWSLAHSTNITYTLFEWLSKLISKWALKAPSFKLLVDMVECVVISSPILEEFISRWDVCKRDFKIGENLVPFTI